MEIYLLTTPYLKIVQPFLHWQKTQCQKPKINSIIQKTKVVVHWAWIHMEESEGNFRYNEEG